MASPPRSLLSERVRCNGAIALIALVSAASAARVSAEDLTRLEFTTTVAEFLNPERGFYRYRNLSSPTDFAAVRAQGQTLIYGRVLANDFRDRP